MGPSVLSVLLVFLNDDIKTLKEYFSWMGIKAHSCCEVQADQHQYLSGNLLDVTQPHGSLSTSRPVEKALLRPLLSNLLPGHFALISQQYYQYPSQPQCLNLWARKRAAAASSMCLSPKQHELPFLNCLPGIKPTRSSFINVPIALFSLSVIISVNISWSLHWSLSPFLLSLMSQACCTIQELQIQFDKLWSCNQLLSCAQFCKEVSATCGKANISLVLLSLML